ncbi:MAG: hypothetical protein CMQ74_00520 [Gammaproteobacteria bacterium]|nr:hypothetical protein [Gammaproteobacteria bacterium]
MVVIVPHQEVLRHLLQQTEQKQRIGKQDLILGVVVYVFVVDLFQMEVVVVGVQIHFGVVKSR